VTSPVRTAPDGLPLHLLVLRAQTGDERAFGRLFEAFGPKTLGYLTGLVGDEAEDVQQEVWLTVFRSLRTLANPGAFRTWLYRTTRHRAIDRLRGMRRQRELFAPAEEEGVEDAAVAAETDTPLRQEELDWLLSGLPPPQREVLLLRYGDELSLAEIALIVGCPVGTVKTRIHHAKRKLREQFTRGVP
jgi:RNA polymerase sigma-70 factor (ECF subfamily)